MREISVMSLDALVELIEHPIERRIAGRSGGTFRARTYAFWDGESYESDLITRVDVRGLGLQSFQRYHGVDVRGPDSAAFEGCGDVSSTWTENFAFAILAVFVGALLAPIFLGARYLFSRIL